eukprot:3492452-Amphidinium_carterae.1
MNKIKEQLTLSSKHLVLLISIVCAFLFLLTCCFATCLRQPLFQVLDPPSLGSALLGRCAGSLLLID